MCSSSSFDHESRLFRSVGVRALDAAQQGGLTIVTMEMIARGLPPILYIRSRGRIGPALYVSTGLPKGTFLAEYLTWRELGRFMDDFSGPMYQDSSPRGPGRWSRHIPASPLVPLPIAHSIEVTKLVGVHTFTVRGEGRFEYAAGFDLSHSRDGRIARGLLLSPREQWVDIVASVVADPDRMATLVPQHYNLVRNALWVEFALDVGHPRK